MDYHAGVAASAGSPFGRGQAPLAVRTCRSDLWNVAFRCKRPAIARLAAGSGMWFEPPPARQRTPERATAHV